MLFVSGKQLEGFNDYLNKCWDDCPIVALFLAVSTFDWVVRRFLLATSKSPTRHIREFLGISVDIERVESVWGKEHDESIDDFVREELKKHEDINSLFNTWDDVKRAYKFSQALKYESTESQDETMMKNYINVLFGAVRLFDFAASEREMDLNKQISHV